MGGPPIIIIINQAPLLGGLCVCVCVCECVCVCVCVCWSSGRLLAAHGNLIEKDRGN